MEFYKIIIVLLIWLFYIIGMVYYNYVLIRFNFIVNHFKNALMTSLLSICLSFLVSNNIIDFTYISILLLFIYWFVFDIGLNLKRGLPSTYIGRKSKMDQLLRKYAKGHILLFKLSLLILTTIIYVCIK
jgi:hypothetical protein